MELTRELIEQAARREGAYGQHPVISVIDAHLPIIQQLNDKSLKIKHNNELYSFVRRSYGFLADAIEDIGDFSLGPLDIAAIWGRATEVFYSSWHLYQRYELAGMACSSYSIRRLGNPAWRRFPRHWLENRRLPETILTDRAGLVHVRLRLGEIEESLEAYDVYICGAEYTGDFAEDLIRREMAGDKEATRHLDEIIARQEERRTPFIDEMTENLSHGIFPLRDELADAIEKTA
ncbi:MAG: hypothetical protein HYW26_00895 [Candidatus Aenigmarchaeota archaeon]|nr:hypothetical protein [Candidatus Aenigmarchaeota archaeon]